MKMTMALIPEPKNSTVAAIYHAYEERAKARLPRPHLGASQIGHSCERKLWFDFRWVRQEKFDGRKLRLFDTGDKEELRLIADLEAAGATVYARKSDGTQWGESTLGGHFGCSVDGVAIGLVEAPQTWHVTEFKTHNAKSFARLLEFGVREAKPEHFAQVQVGMGLLGLTRCMYLAVNKDTDDLYSERINYDELVYQQLLAKANRVIFASRPAAPVNGTDFQKAPCQYITRQGEVKGQCTFLKFCNPGDGSLQRPDFNCRTCLHSTPRGDGSWLCEKKKEALTVEAQRAGCEDHLYVPDLFPVEFLGGDEQTIKYKRGETVFYNHAGGTIDDIPF